MLHEFQAHIKSLGITQSDPILLTVSGGIDSVVMSHLFFKSELNFGIAHCNFNLRGDESDKDATFVRKLSEKFNCKFFETTFNTKVHKEKHKLSIQLAARELRYQWFEEIRVANNYSKTATGHHLNDSFETFVINLSRGSGLKGLLGIPEQTDTLLRPLLPFSRRMILNHAQKHQLEWREDSSNATLDYLRNQLRHDVIPELIKVQPQFLDGFKTSLLNLNSTSLVFDQLVNDFKEKYFFIDKELIYISNESLISIQSNDSLWYELFRAYGFPDLESLKSLVSAQSGKFLESDTHRILKDRDHLIISVKKELDKSKSYFVLEDTQEITVPLNLKFEQNNLVNSPNNEIAFLKFDKIKFPLKIRKWEEGDHFFPSGMKGKKLISKFFKDQKFSKIQKENQWLLCSENQIIWVIGHRCDERYISPSAYKKNLKITLID
jgi:tRNA(Ile)-lysidine synthase